MCMFRHEYDDLDTSLTVEKEKGKSDKPTEIIYVQEQAESVFDKSINIEDGNSNKTNLQTVTCLNAKFLTFIHQQVKD